MDNTRHHDVSDHENETDEYHFMSLDKSSRELSGKIFISLTNMNLYSVDFDKHKKLGRSLSSSSFSGFTQELGVPILYDTAVDLYISKHNLDIMCVNDNLAGDQDVPEEFAFPHHPKPNQEQQALPPSSVLEVSIKISSPIKLGLSKEVYEQILQTSDHLIYEVEIKDAGIRDFEGASSGSVPQQPCSGTSDEASERSGTGGGVGEGGLLGKERWLVDKKLKEASPSQPGTAHRLEAEPVAGTFMAKHIKFQVPLFEVELRGDFGEGEQGLVDLQLHDFAMDYEKNDRASTHLKLRLRSLQMDDLLEPCNSAHRQIIVSRNTRREPGGGLGERSQHRSGCFLSTSCPDCTIVVPVPQMPRSLPSSFHDAHSPKAAHKVRDIMANGGMPLQRPSSRYLLFTSLLPSQTGQSLHPWAFEH